MRATRFSPSAISFGIPIFMYPLQILQCCVSTQRKGGLAWAIPPSHVYHIRFSVTVIVFTPLIIENWRRRDQPTDDQHQAPEAWQTCAPRGYLLRVRAVLY